MQIRPIRTEADYKATLKEVSRLMERDPDLGTPDGDRLDVLVTLVQAYEAKHYPIGLPDPIDAIKFRMEQAGLTAKDLEPMIGQRNRVYEILNRKRALTLPMIWKLHRWPVLHCKSPASLCRANSTICSIPVILAIKRSQKTPKSCRCQ